MSRTAWLHSTSAAAILAASLVIASTTHAVAQSNSDLYAIVKSLQERVDTLETQNRNAQRATAEAREEALRAQSEAKELRRRLESTGPAAASAGTASASVRPSAASASASVPSVVTKAPGLAPRETVVTAVAAPVPNYYTVGVTPFATLAPGSPVVPAVVPIRVLPTGAPELDSLSRGLRVGDNLALQAYGTITGTYSHDSSSPYGLSSPAPGFNPVVNAPTDFPATHLNARNSIFGGAAFWRDPTRGVTATGKLELDLNGNFNGGGPLGSGINSIQSLGSYSPRVRLAYGRADLAVTPSTDFFVLGGQDWTPFASSTQPHLLDTDTLGAGFGNIWARLPQVRAGLSQDLGTPWAMRLQVEGAVVQPAWGDLPAAVGSNNSVNLNTNVVPNTLLAFGERQGADSDHPEIQGRAVLQFQLDPAEGVAPAQLIASGMYGRRTAVVTANQVPAAFAAAFPAGAQINDSRYGWTAEAQLPTRWLTVSGKYYEGTGLRFYGGGQLFAEFNDTPGLTNTATAPTIDGASTLVFGRLGGAPVVAGQVEPHANGGFITVGVPFSRWMGANPQGFAGGWTGYASFGRDQVRPEDVARSGGGRETGDFWAAQLEYRPISNLIFGAEVSRYHTHAIPQTATGLCPLQQGVPNCDWMDNRVVGSVTFAY